MKKQITEKKKIQKIIEVEEDVPTTIVDDNKKEFEDAFGKQVVIFGTIYIYTGIVVGVNDTRVLLKDTHIVYQTGDFKLYHKNGKFADQQLLPVKEHTVRFAQIESWGVLEKN